MLLQPIFAKQRELMEKYSAIEVGVETHEIPVDINTREGQNRLRQFAWFFTEEIGEAISARGRSNFHEELIDALHFITEFAILSGLTHSEVTPPWVQPAPKPTVLTLTSDWAPRALAAIHGMCHAVNALKAKPWKQSWKPTDVRLFQVRVVEAYHRMLELLHYSGISMDDLERLYTQKNQTNHQRIQDGY